MDRTATRLRVAAVKRCCSVSESVQQPNSMYVPTHPVANDIGMAHDDFKLVAFFRLGWIVVGSIKVLLEG